jgi:hypothetical protein
VVSVNPMYRSLPLPYLWGFRKRGRFRREGNIEKKKEIRSLALIGQRKTLYPNLIHDYYKKVILTFSHYSINDKISISINL